MKKRFFQGGVIALALLLGAAVPVYADSPGLIQAVCMSLLKRLGVVNAAGAYVPGGNETLAQTLALGADANQASITNLQALAVTNNAANNNSLLTLTKSPSGAQSGNGATITLGAQATGRGIDISHAGASGFGMTISVSGGADGLNIAHAAGSGSALSVASSGNSGANALTLNRNPSSSSGGSGLALAMGGNSTGRGIDVAMSSGATGPPLYIDATWNSGGTTFRGIEFSVTNTASAAASSLLRLRAGSGGTTAVFGVNPLGGISLGDYDAAAVGGPTTETSILLYTAAAASYPLIYLIQENGSTVQTYQCNRYSATAASGVKWFAYRGRGSSSSPSGLSAADSIFQLKGIGVRTSDNAARDSASMAIEVDAATGTEVPGRFVWQTSTSSSALVSRMALDSAGALKLSSGGAYGFTGSATDPTAAFEVAISRASSTNLSMDTSTAGNGLATVELGGVVDTNKTIDTTAGDSATINAISGRFRKDTSGATFTLTNNKVTANSIVVATLMTTGTGVTWIVAVPTTDTITFTLSGAPSGNLDINFWVVN